MPGDASLRDPKVHWQWTHDHPDAMFDPNRPMFVVERLTDRGRGRRRRQAGLVNQDMEGSVLHEVQSLQVHQVEAA